MISQNFVFHSALSEKQTNKKKTGGRKDVKDGLRESTDKLHAKGPANLLIYSVPVSHIQSEMALKLSTVLDAFMKHFIEI